MEMMHHAKTDSEVTSNAPSSPGRSPRRPVYYVQSPSRDSHDGEKTATMSLHSSPPVLSPAHSPPHSHSSVGRHSRESSSSRFSGSLKPGSRKVTPNDPTAGGSAGRGRKGDKAWKDRCDVIEEEGLLEGEAEERGIPRRCYVLAFMAAFLVLFFFFALILWGASHNQTPVVAMKSITFENFYIQAGTDASLVPTNLATVNSTLKFTYRNTGSFFGVHVTPTPVSLSYYQLTMATGSIHKFYQSRKSQRYVSVVVSGSGVPMYGGGSSLNSAPGKNSAPVNLTLDFTVRSRAYVLGKLVKPKFDNGVHCLVVLDPNKLGKAVSLKSSCHYNS